MRRSPATRPRVTWLLLFLLFPGRTSPAQQAEVALEPPVAQVIPEKLEKYGHVRIDNYYWLKERDNPEVIAYLEAENAYTDAVMAHTTGLQEALFEEFMGRIKQTDMSVPYRMDDYYYYTREEEGKEYPIYCRKRGSLDAPDEVMLDVNAMAEGHEFFAIGQWTISSDQDLLAFAADTLGRNIYTLYVKDLATGELLEDVIPEVAGNLAWANDNCTLFYTRQDPTTLRWDRVFRHHLGEPPSGDELVFEEKDAEFGCYVFKTKSKEYLMIESYQTLSTEYRFLDADDPEGPFTVFLPRGAEHEYEVDHYAGHFFIRTNDGAKNFRLMKTPVDRTGKENWEEVIPHREDVLLEGFEIFKEYLVVEERRDGLIQLRIQPWTGGGEHHIDFGEPAYWASVGENYSFDTPTLRYEYTSMTTPLSVYDYNMASREKVLLKREEVLGGFDPANYRTERIWATAGDGKKVPISLVYRKGMARDGSHPLLLYGYGSYGISMDAHFNPFRISLLDRGFIYAIAHVRGGEELGRSWYEDGKLLKKVNTFTDFIACAEHLTKENYTRPDRLYAMGGSAGGLLMGAVVNMRPDLFHGVVAEVPFVDALTTMLDETIPLTTAEYDEWGNPGVKEYYDYILSYSPYDNVETKAYPNLLVTTGLHDASVQYWEPAKWVAKLRATRTGHNHLLLKTRMEAGHGGVSGRYRQYRETAFTYAFLLDLARMGR